MKTKLPPLPPEANIIHVPYERPIVDAVDKIMQLAKQAGYSGTVQTEKHWEIVLFLFKMFVDLYPQDYTQFHKWQTRLKTDKKNKNATNREGEALMQHQIEIPMKFYQLLTAVFPHQKFDKQFVAKLGNRMPLLKVPDSKL